MSSSVIVERQNRNGRIEAAPRLVPGGSALHAIPKKNPLSITHAATVCAPATPHQISLKSRRLLRSLAEGLLPRPWAPVGQWSLWRAVFCDFALTVAVFVAITRIHLTSHSVYQLSRFDIVNSPSAAESRSLLGFGLIYGAVVTLVAYSEGLYRQRTHAAKEQVGTVFKAVWLGTLFIGAAITVSTPNSPTPAIFLCSGILTFAGLLGWRMCNWHMVAKERAVGHGVRNVLIVGGGTHGRELVDYFEANPQMGRAVKGFVDEYLPLGGEVLGRVDDLPLIARENFIDEVILTPGIDGAARKVTRLARQYKLDLWLVPELFGSEPKQPHMEWMGRLPVIALHQERLPEFALFIKRAIDMLLSSFLLAVLFPLMAVISLVIKLDTPGPLLYRAARVGRKGKRFSCYKFRTMATNADALKENLRCLNQRHGPCFKIAQDPRVTRVGRFLRRYSLDELPQLWNVVRGEMSLVGPRPHPLDDVSRYELAHLQRLDVTPGITGLWQVNARQDPSFGTTLALDLKYIEEWNLWLDLRILFKTFSAVLMGTGV